MKKLIALCLSVLMLLSMAACAQKQPQTEPETTAPASEAEPAAETQQTQAPEEKGGYKVAFVNFSLGNSYRVQLQEEFIAQAEAYKAEGIVSEYYVTNSDGDIAQQIADVRDMITKGVNAICITACSDTALAPVCEEAVDAGIAVVDFDNMVASDKLTSSIRVDEYEFGRVGMQWLAEELGGKGSIVCLNYETGTPTNDARRAGVQSVLDEYPEIQVLGEADAECDYATGKAAMESFLSAYGDQINGVWSLGGAMTQGAVDAYNAGGYALVPMTGEGNNGFLRTWKENSEAGFTSIAPSFTTATSAIALRTAVQWLNGEEVEPIIYVDLSVVTEDTLDEYYAPDMPDSYWVFTELSEEALAKLYAN